MCVCVCLSQVGGEALVAEDDHVGGDVLLAVRPPERAQLRAHVAPLVVRVLVAGRHLLHRVDVHVDVRGRVRRVEHLAEGQHEAARRVLGGVGGGEERGGGGFSECRQVANDSLMRRAGVGSRHPLCEGTICV